MTPEQQPGTAQAESWASVADALAGTPALVAVTDGPLHDLVYTNDAYLEVFGRDAADSAPDGFANGSHPDLAAEASVAILDSVYHSGRPHSRRAVPVQLVASNGLRRRGLFTFVYLPLRSQARQVSGLLVVAVDITNEGRAEPVAELRRAGDRRRESPPRDGYEADELQVAVGSAGAGGRVWHDVVPLGAGRTGIVIGDVRDSGAAGSVVRGQLRAAVRAYAQLDLPPGEVLALLDALVADVAHSTPVTCGYAVFDPTENTLTYASAGHPAPLLLDGGAKAAPLLVDVGVPLGSGGGTFGEQVRTLEQGSVAALYTADLLAGPGQDPANGADRLAEALDAERGSLDERCVAVLGRLVDAAAEPQDALLLVLGRRELGGRTPRSIELELREGREPARRARAFCHGVLSTWQVPDHKREDIVLVVSELVTNAILHGGAAEQLRLRRTDRRVVIEVFDQGLQMPHPRAADFKAESGRGLHLVARLADRWGARPVGGGKAVWCEFDTPLPEVAGRRRGGGESQALSG